MICPKCGFQQPESPECARCGIIISRYRGAASGAATGAFASPPVPPPPSPLPDLGPDLGTVLGDPPPAAAAASTGTVYGGPPPGSGTVYQGPAPGAQPSRPVTALSIPVTQKLRVGETLSEAFAIFGRNIIPFSILAAVAYSPLYLIGDYVMHRVTAQGSSPLAVSGIEALATLATVVLCIPLSTATITYGVFQQMRGRAASLGSCLSVGLSNLLPVLSVAFLQILFIFAAVFLAALLVGFLIGMVVSGGTRSSAACGLMLVPLLLLCYVPAVMLLLRFFVAVPAAVEERPGAMNALRRSAFLTEGQRWRIFGILLVLGAFNGGVLIVAGKVPVAGPVLQPLLTLLTTGLFATASAVIYYRLRSFHESIDVDQIASVFA